MATNPSFAALEKALDFEREGIEYFTSAINRTSHPVAKAMFELLIDQEKKHIDYLSLMYDRLKAEDRWPRDITIDLDMDFKHIFREAIKNIDETVKVYTDEIEAVSYAVDLENRGRKMYRELSEKATDALEKEFYARLSEWERGHAEYLEDFYNYFQDKGLFTRE
ncbi:MAG: ferritin family protein [bacterium]